MATDHIRYDVLARDALRGVLRRVLTDAAEHGLPGDHHFFITFLSTADGVKLSPRLLAQYPEEMTIILQHQFWDLTVTEDRFEVGLSFGGVPERLVVPFSSIKSFFVPSVQFAERGNQVGEDAGGGGDVHRGRKRVVRRLAHIDVIVWMHRLLGAELAAQHFVGAIGDHLVEVHVGLGAGPGLPDHQRKVPVELAVDHLARGADDGAGAAPVEQSEFAIRLGGSKLDHAERMNDRHRHPLITDAEISPRPFGLGTPVAIGGNVDRAETVGLAAGGVLSR